MQGSITLGFGVSFKALYDSGKINEQVIDRVLFHTILPIFKVGVFDHPPTGAPSEPEYRHRNILPFRIASSKKVRFSQEQRTISSHILPDKVKTHSSDRCGSGARRDYRRAWPNGLCGKAQRTCGGHRSRAGSSIKVTYVKAGAGIRPLPILRGDAIHASPGEAIGLMASYFRSGDLSGRAGRDSCGPCDGF